MSEKNLIVHSDEVEKWSNLRDPGSKEKHLEVINDIREKGALEITSEKDPESASELFEPGDKVALYGQSTGKFGCVTRAAEALRKKGVKVKLSVTPYSTLPWPRPQPQEEKEY